MIWDLYIALLLVYSCMTTPARIAFGYQDGDYKWQFTENVIDSSFGFDMFLMFFTAIEDDELR